MKTENKRITKSYKLDLLLVYFPIWFPITYLFGISNFPTYSQLFFLTAIFLFAETHFASTWLFFFDKSNYKWIKKNFFKLVIIPIYFLIIFVAVWFFSPSFVLILHYLASGYHVTRQSVGITKLSGTYSKIDTFLIYIFSSICLIIGLAKPGILNIYFNANNNFLAVLALLYFLIILFSTKKNFALLKRFLPLLTGISIYLPLLFFDNLAIATIIGVGMHWCQYLTIMFAINIKKRIEKNSNNFLVFLKKRILFVLTYSLIMSSLTFLGMPVNQVNKNYSVLYLIPIIFQLFHFYIDGFIWKFSDKHIRKSVGSYLIT